MTWHVVSSVASEGRQRCVYRNWIAAEPGPSAISCPSEIQACGIPTVTASGVDMFLQSDQISPRFTRYSAYAAYPPPCGRSANSSNMARHEEMPTGSGNTQLTTEDHDPGIVFFEAGSPPKNWRSEAELFAGAQASIEGRADPAVNTQVEGTAPSV